MGWVSRVGRAVSEHDENTIEGAVLFDAHLLNETALPLDFNLTQDVYADIYYFETRAKEEELRSTQHDAFLGLASHIDALF